MSPWTLKINDPAAIAWLCVAGYMIAAIACWIARRNSSSLAERNLWLGLFLSCVLLGLNKQSDVHSFLLEAWRGDTDGRAINMTGVTLGFVFVVTGTCAAYFVLRNLNMATKWTFPAVASVFLLGFILAGRNALPSLSSFLGWHLITEEDTLLHVHLSEILEICLIGVMVYSSNRHKRPTLQVNASSP